MLLNIYTISGVSILIDGVIPIPATTSYDKLHFIKFFKCSQVKSRPTLTTSKQVKCYPLFLRVDKAC